MRVCLKYFGFWVGSSMNRLKISVSGSVYHCKILMEILIYTDTDITFTTMSPLQVWEFSKTQWEIELNSGEFLLQSYLQFKET